MKHLPISPATKRLRESIMAYAQMDGVEGETLAMMVITITGLLASRWDQIGDSAMDEEDEGKISVGIRLALDYTHKIRKGAAELGFVPKRVKDGVTFQVDDPDQAALPFEEPSHVQAGP